MSGPEFFRNTTPAGHEVFLEVSSFVRHIQQGKVGAELPSVFEIKDAANTPVEVLQSMKNPAAFFYVKPVGQLGRNQWFTVVLVQPDQATDYRVATGYNALSYTKKGTKVWP